MIKFITILVTVLGLSFTSYASEVKKEVLKSTKKEVAKTPVITISNYNTVILKGTVRGRTVAKVQQKLLKISERLRQEETIYLVLDTPGGSIYAGLELIDFAKSLPQKVITITINAASMGFVITQALDDRYILPSGTLMMHRATVGIRGQINNGEFETRSNHIKEVVQDIESFMIKRIGVSLESYREIVKDEVYNNGKQAVESNFADKVVLIRCGKDMSGSYSEEVRSFWGNFWVTWSKCPTITAPLDVRATFNLQKYTKEQQVNILNRIKNFDYGLEQEDGLQWIKKD